MKKQAALLAAATILICTKLPTLAATTPEELVAAIYKAKVLPPGISVRVDVKGDQALISTFRKGESTDKECKVDAILLAHTLIEEARAPFARVTVYYYNATDINKYKMVSVSAGDVKAYGSNQVSMDQLISSVQITQQESTTDNISHYLEGSQTREHPITVVAKNDSLNISTEMDSWVSERDCKLEAFKLANQALLAAPNNIKSVHIILTDPANPNSSREAIFNRASVRGLNAQVDSLLAPVTLVATSVAPEGAESVENMKTVDGALKDDREQLLQRIQQLAKNGVGVRQFITAFAGIEQQVGKADEAALSDSIKRLSNAVETQEKVYKAAKEFKAGGPKTSEAAVKRTTPPSITWGKENRWVLGTEPIDPGRVQQDPDTYLGEIERKLPKAQENPRFFHTLRFFTEVLVQASHDDSNVNKQSCCDEAWKIMDRISKIQSKHPEFAR